MGKALLFICVPIWVCLGLSLLGQLLAKFSLTKSIGVGLQWMSVVPWLLGIGLISYFAYDYLLRFPESGKDWISPLFLAFMTALPVYFTSRRYFEVLGEYFRAKNSHLSPETPTEHRVAAPPNPSIERTSPGKPGTASHVKR